MADEVENTSDGEDGGTRGRALRRSWFSDQGQVTRDDIITAGFNKKNPTSDDKNKALKPYK